ncbi:MAG: MATE family efflux transporter, partial [Clostridia bacterium]|nr:MATE family efflux transporter [Clostridia bacterium]
PFQVSQVIYRGCLNGAGDTKYTAVVSFISIALVRPVLTYVLCYPVGLGVYGAWISLFLDQVTRFGFTTHRFGGSNWYKRKI